MLGWFKTRNVKLHIIEFNLISYYISVNDILDDVDDIIKQKESEYFNFFFSINNRRVVEPA